MPETIFPTAALVGFLAGLAAVAYVWVKHRHLLSLFSIRRHKVNVGPHTFVLRYIHFLRNPSGRIVLVWTDEIGRTHSQLDPRVLIVETAGSIIARLLRRAPAPETSVYEHAAKDHIGHGRGWLVITSIDTHRYPLTRQIAFCVAHIALLGTETKRPPEGGLSSSAVT